MPIASQIDYPNTGAPSKLHRYNSDSFIDNHASSRFRQLTSIVGSENSDNRSDHRDAHPFRKRVGQILHDERFDLFILILIAINSALYGVVTFPSIKQNTALISDFEKVDLTILVVFTVESCMNLFYEGKRFVKDGWLMFDLLIVTISWVAMKVKSLQVFRIFRAFRFLTKVEILRNIVVALFSVVPAIAAISVLLLLILFIFSVMCTQLYKDFYEEGYTTANYFGTLDLTLFSLFQIMCLVSQSPCVMLCLFLSYYGDRFTYYSCSFLTLNLHNMQDEWSGIAYEVGEEDYWAWLIFIIFVVMSAFVVVNLIIAVICDALQILRKAERAMISQNIVFELNEEDSEERIPMEDNDEKSSEGDRIQEKISEMHRMLDEVAVSQERMNRTIQYLSIVVESQGGNRQRD